MIRPFLSTRLLGAMLVLAVLAVLAVLSGCHARDAGAPASAAAPAAPVRGGELVFAFDGAAGTSFALDPEQSGFAPHHRVMRSIYDSLVVLLPGHRFGPWLATSWAVSPDGRAWTFKLRDDVHFHDGTRFDAAAVKFNLDRLEDPKNALVAVSDVLPYDNSEVVDDFTIRILLKTPYAPLLANLSKTSLGMVSPAAVKAEGKGFLQHPVGTGPFKFVSMQPGTEIVLERNADYHWPPQGAANPGAAYIDRLVFKNVPEEATRVAVLENGQAGVADIIPPQNLLALRGDPAYRVIDGELLNLNYALYLNQTRQPWDDEAVRRAFRLSLDLDAAVRTVDLGTMKRAWTPLSPAILGYDKRFENSWKPDPAQARALLEERGWKAGPDGVRQKDGKRLTLVLLDAQGNREKRLDILTMLRRQLADTGFELRIESVAGGSYLERVAARDFDLLGGSLFAPDPDVLRRIFSPGLRSRSGYTSVNDAELERLLDAGYQEQDLDKRVAIYGKAQKIILDKTYAIPVYVLTYFVATRAQVHGVTIDGHGFPEFQGAWVQP
jgi:peptide/nickel transport system substrate-binding protein